MQTLTCANSNGGLKSKHVESWSLTTENIRSPLSHCLHTYTVKCTFIHMVLQEHVANLTHYISNTRFSMTTKLDMIVTHLEDLQPINSHDPLLRVLTKSHD